MKTFLALILVVLAIAEDISNDVTTVAPTSKPTEIPSDITGGCSTCTGSELDNYFSNREFVEKRRTKKNDKSVIYSIYMKEDRTAFNDTCMIHGLEYMHRTNENKQPNVPDSKNHLTNADLVDAVSTSLGDLPLNYNDNDYSDKFVIYALTDLMNVMYQISHGTVRKWKFNADLLYQEVKDLGRNPIDKSDVLKTIQEVGMCLDSESNPCTRYSFEKRESITIKTNYQIQSMMSYSPLYVQVGIDPLYYQLYGPKAEEPLHACFGEPNMAGVLVGYNFASYDNSADNYWVMYARRHGTGYNEVKIRVDLTHKEDTSGGASAVADTEYVGKATDAKLACGLGAVVYRIDLGSGDSSINFNANHVWNYQPSTGFAPLANKEALKSLIDTDVTTPANINVVYFHSGVFATEWSEPATITDYLPNVEIVYFINDNNCSEEKSKWFSSEDEVPVECILNQ